MNNFLSFRIPCLELEKQKRIVQLLDFAFELKQKRKKAIELLDEYLRSVFYDLFGNPVKNEKGWEVRKIIEIAENNKHSLKAGPFGSSLKKEYYCESGYKIYGQEQVIKDDLNYGDYYIDESKFQTLKQYSIKAGDILISLVGTFGKISVVPDNFIPGIINPRLMKLSLNNNKILPKFFKYLFTTRESLYKLKTISHGGTMDIINVSILKDFVIVLPPLDKQRQFISILDQVEKTKAKMLVSLKEMDNLFNSLMQQAFRDSLCR